MIRIRSKRHLFRRCGMAHPKEPVDYEDDFFTPEQLDILKAEPTLIVETDLEEPESSSRGSAEAQESGGQGQEADDAGPSRETEEPLGESPEGKSDEALLIEAAKQAAGAGKVTKEGRPLVEAMEEILGREISAADRDRAFEAAIKGS